MLDFYYNTWSIRLFNKMENFSIKNLQEYLDVLTHLYKYFVIETTSDPERKYRYYVKHNSKKWKQMIVFYSNDSPVDLLYLKNQLITYTLDNPKCKNKTRNWPVSNKKKREISNNHKYIFVLLGK